MAKKRGEHYIDKTEFTNEIIKSLQQFKHKVATGNKEEEEIKIKDFIDRGVCKNRKEAEKFVLQIYRSESLTKRALSLFLLISERAIKKLHYENPDDEKDCLATIHGDLIRYWTSFNPDAGLDAFAYFTSVVYTAAAKGWKALYPKKYEGTISLNANSKNDGQGIYTV